LAQARRPPWCALPPLRVWAALCASAMAANAAEDPPDFGGDDDEEQQPGTPNGEGLASAADTALASLYNLSTTESVRKRQQMRKGQGMRKRNQRARASDAQKDAAAAPAPALAPAPAPVPANTVPMGTVRPPPGLALPPAPIGPHVVMPPGGAPGIVLAPQEGVMPRDTNGEAWLELDGFCHQFREENECKEPPPYHRAMQFAADQSVPPGNDPRLALNLQLQLLLRLRAGEAAVQLMQGKGGKQGDGKQAKGPCSSPEHWTGQQCSSDLEADATGYKTEYQSRASAAASATPDGSSAGIRRESGSLGLSTMRKEFWEKCHSV